MYNIEEWDLLCLWTLTDFPVPPNVLFNESAILERHCTLFFVKYHFLDKENINLIFWLT